MHVFIPSYYTDNEKISNETSNDDDGEENGYQEWHDDHQGFQVIISLTFIGIWNTNWTNINFSYIQGFTDVYGQMFTYNLTLSIHHPRNQFGGEYC